MCRYLGTIVGLLLCALPLQAGTVQTLSGRLQGKVVIHKDHVSVEDKRLGWEEIVYVLSDTETLLPRPQWIHLKSGESWAVELVGMADSEIQIRSELFGAAKVGLDQVTAIEFARPPGREKNRQVEVLYRVKGEAVPGKLLAIKADRVFLDSIVGEVELPRQDLVAYGFTDRQPSWKTGEDEITLIDGSVFRGKMTIAGDEHGLEVEHALLNRLKLPLKIVRAIVRRPKETLDLVELGPASVEGGDVPPADKAVSPIVRLLRGAENGGRFVKGLAIEPKTTMRYKLPEAKGKKVRLSALLLPLAAARGNARAKILSGDKVIVEKTVARNARPETLALEIDAGKELEIVVDCDDRLRFPCGIVLGDPHVIVGSE